MKCTIIYFSQTGNTEKIARAIQKGVAQEAGPCDIVRIKDADPRRLYQYDLIGLGFPVIGFVEPLNVQAFIRKMRYVGGKHAFVFDTHGTRHEFVFPSVVPKLRRKNMTVIGMYDCYASVGGQENCPTGGHPDEIDLKEAEAFGRQTAERSRRIFAGEANLIPSYPEYVEYHVNKFITERQAREKELGMPAPVAERRSMLEYDRRKCRYPKCRLCMDNCPMEGIDLSMDPPEVGKPCMRCMTCVSVCPTDAMSMARPGGDGPPNMGGTAWEAVFQEFYMAPLAKAEAEGRFRRLVPIDKVNHGGGLGPRKKKPNQ